jgi:hypothetical protein
MRLRQLRQQVSDRQRVPLMLHRPISSWGSAHSKSSSVMPKRRGFRARGMT